MRGVTTEELIGFRDALLELCRRVDLSDFDTIDLCGTGGDEKNTFNISTLASFVVAGAGVKVSKHGNYGVSSVSGSSNVLEHLGYTFKNDPDELKRELDKAGICFMHAPLFHPAMKTVAPIRKELGIKTFFNMLGPMVNPAFPKNQMVGVFSLELARMYQYIYQETEKNFSIVHCLGGYDEISLTAPAKVLTNSMDGELEPEAFGMNRITAESIFGGETVAESARIFISVLAGEGTVEQENVVIANAALGIQCATRQSLENAVELARESLQSKKALQSFNQLIAKN